MEIVSLKCGSLVPHLVCPGPPISRRRTHDILRAGFWGLKQPTFYTYEMLVPLRRRLHVKESRWTEPTVQVWPHNVFLCKYLEMQAEREGPQYFTDKTVLELGAGCGLTGMVASMLGASVTVVEKASLFPLLRHNVDSFSAEWKGELQIRCEEEKDALGKLKSKDNQAKNACFDLIICSDVSAGKELHYSFLLTVLTLMGENSDVLLCHTRSCSKNDICAATNKNQDCFMLRLSEIFQVVEMASEDTIRAFCEQLSGPGQLLRSQSTIDIQECSDAEGQLVIFRLRCSRKVEALQAYVQEQLQKEAALQHERKNFKPSGHNSPEGVLNTMSKESGLTGVHAVTGEKGAADSPSTTHCLRNEFPSVFSKEEHTGNASLRRSSHKRTFSGTHDLRHTDTTTAGCVWSRIIRPRITAGSKRESLPSAINVPLDSHAGSSSLASLRNPLSCGGVTAAGDVQKNGSDTRLLPRTTQSSAARSQSIGAGKKVTELSNGSCTSPVQGRQTSSTAERSEEKLQQASVAGDRARVVHRSGLRLSCSSSTTRTQLHPHLGGAPSQGSPSNGLRSRMLSIAFRDKGGISYFPLKENLASQNNLRTKASCSAMSVDAERPQLQSSDCTMITKVHLSKTGATPTSCSTDRSRAVPSFIVPASDASCPVGGRGRSALREAADSQNSASTALLKDAVRPSSTMEPSYTRTLRSKMLRHAQPHTNLQPSEVSHTVTMENTSPNSRMLSSSQHVQQRSRETLGAGGAGKGMSVSSRLSVKTPSGLHSTQEREPVSFEKRISRRLSATPHLTGSSPSRKQENGRPLIQSKPCDEHSGFVGRRGNKSQKT